MDPETRAYLDDIRQQISILGEALRGEMGALGTTLRSEMDTLGGTLRGEIGTLGETLRGEIDTLGESLRGEMATMAHTLRAEVRQGDADTRSQLGAMIEAQRHDLAAVAEGVAANTMAIDRLHRDMDGRFEAVRAAFVVVRRDIEELRAQP